MVLLNRAKDEIKNKLRQYGIGLYKVPIYARADHHNSYLYYKRLFDSIRNIEGDIIECGIGVGRTFSILAGLAEDEGVGRKLFGFDSFEGFPEPTKEDISLRNPKKREWDYATPDFIKTRLCCNGIGDFFIEKNIKLIKGFFVDTLPLYKGQIALLHLDVDLHDSYKVCLETLYSKVALGGVIMFDEYKNTAAIFPGAVKAIDDFFVEKKNLIRVDTFTNLYYFIKQ